MIPLTVHDDAGTRWRVARAWPDGSGAVAELVDDAPGGARPGAPQQIRAGRWEAGRVRILPYGTDPKLPALAPALAAASGGDSGLVVHRYGKRAVVQGPQGFTKILRPGRAAAVADRHDLAARALADRRLAASIRIPVLLHRSDDTMTLSRIPGRPLGELGRDPAVDVGPAWTALGGWLGATMRYQGTRPAGHPELPHHTAGDEAGIVTGWVDRLVRTGLLGAETSARLGRLARSVAAELEAGDTGSRVPVHRDLHDGQLLWDGGQLGLIDLDTAAAAEPAVDPGNLLAHLELRARQWHGADSVDGADEQLAPAVARRMGELLLAGIDPAPTLLQRIRVYQRASVLRLIGVYAWRPRWRATAVGWAEDLTGTSPSLPAVAEDENSLINASFPGHEWAAG